MKKKRLYTVISLIIAILVFAGIPVISYANNFLQFIDYSLYKGSWVTCCEVLDMYLPNSWIEYQLTDEMKKSGLGLVVGSSDGEWLMAIDYSTPYQMKYEMNSTNSQELVEELLSEGYKDAYRIDINGIDCVAFGEPSQDMYNIVIFDLDKGAYAINFYPISDPDFNKYAINIMYSISLPD